MDDYELEPFLRAMLNPKIELDLEHFNYSVVTRDWKFVNRTLPEHLVYFVVRNACRGQVSGHSFYVEPNDLMWISAGVKHSVENVNPSTPVGLFHFRLRLLKSGTAINTNHTLMLRRNASELRPLAEQLSDEIKARLPFRDTRLRALFYLFFSSVVRMSGEDQQAGPILNRSRRDKLQAFIDQHESDPIGPTDLAHALKLTPDYFSRVFRNTYGQAPRTWLVHDRIRRATNRLAESDLSLTRISEAFGYSDLYVFSRQFKQVMGISPRAYRKSKR